MAVRYSKQVIKQGDGRTFPREGDSVTLSYTGWIYDADVADRRGEQFDSSIGRGDFKTEIGRGLVIKGWDIAVQQMSLGEEALLTIPCAMAYGERGFSGFIDPNSDLIFKLTLKKID